MGQHLDETVARSALYKLLSLSFAQPRDQSAELFSGIDRIVRALPEIHQALLRPVIEERAMAGIGPTEREHTRLFGVGLAVTPYETEYDPLASARKGHRLADLLGFYEAFGFRLAGHQTDFPDHIAIELEFMSLLLLKIAHAEASSVAEARAVAEEAAQKFLSDHLAGWGGLFAERAEATTEEEFYRSTARVLSRFLLAECQILGVEPIPSATLPKDPGPLTCPFASECSELSGGI